jgi:predicted TIM-barrel fold metal-dependent hydrolase
VASNKSSYLRDLVAKQDRTATVTFIPEPEPEELFCPLISVDDHALEPADMFEGRLASKWHDVAPRIEYDDDGVPAWVVDGARLPIILTNGASGRVRAEWKGAARCKYEEFRPGVYDPAARLHDMDLTGVWASLCFGSAIWGFAGSRFARLRDPEFGLDVLRAYNDWMLEGWCGVAPERYIPCQMPWLADPQVAAQEIYRNAERGFRAVSFVENPEGLRLPTIYDAHWDPFLRACEETETVVNLHVGSSGRVANPSSASPPDVIVALFPLSGMEAIADWVFARVPLRFPNIKIALSEAGVSWVPMMLERLGRAYRVVEASEAWSADDPAPVDLVRRNFFFTSIEDPSAFRSLDLIGEDNVMVEVDYPHLDSTWPDSQAMIRSELEHLPAETIRKVCYGNAARLYRHPEPPDRLVEASVVGALSRADTPGN